MKKILLLITLSLLFFHSYAATFDCNSTSDAAGNGTTRTLRYCITQANLTAAADIINFSVSGTWTVGSNYPTIIYPLTINGYSAPGTTQGALGASTRVLTVTLNGPGNSTVYGFNITASNCEISGLVIQDFYKGIYIDGGDNNWIWGCYIGTATNGASIATTTTCYDDGIALNNNANNTIIGTNGNGTNDANEGNLLSGNGDSGVQYTGEGIAVNEGGAIGQDCTGTWIAGNYIGVDEIGTTALYPGATADLQRGSGIQINYSTANIIGTNGDGVSDAFERNIISGNSDCGIVFVGATGCKVKGNYIGTTKTGLVGLPNYGNEGTKINAVQMTIKTASNNNFFGTDGDGTGDNVEGNIFGSLTIANGASNISYNYTVFNSASTGNRYSGNRFGIGADGTTVMNIKTTSGPYIDKCIYISSSSTSTIVGTNGDGTSDALEANYFGNSGIGVAIDNSNNCIAAGNYFGLGTNLTTAETLTTSGVYILNSTSCRIGSSASNSLEMNYFCNSSQYGIWIDGNATSNSDLNNIRYNTIGMRPDGATAANGYNGIYIYRLSNSNTIQYNTISKNGTASSTGAYAAIQLGGAGASEESVLNTINNNTIYKNIGPAIAVLNSNSVQNKITQNSIYNNGNGSDVTGKLKLGIDLVNNGVTANDVNDGDSGPNILMNFPVITSAVPGGAGCNELISGTFNSGKNDQYWIEVYSSDVCNGDTSGVDNYLTAGSNYGEGRTYLGATSVFTVDNSYIYNWSITVPLASITGKYITAVAISFDASPGSTSEFSQCYWAQWDCGDAPDTYKTLLASCGPIHENIGNTLKFGTTVTSDADGQPSAQANLDTDDGIATLPTLTNITTSYTISSIPVTNSTGSAATLYAWIDVNQNGSFESTEYTSVSVPSSGAQNVNLTWNLSAFTCGTTINTGNTYMRLRLTTDALSDNGGTSAIDERCYGTATNGEVEDYKIYIHGIDYGDLKVAYPTASTIALEDTATAKVWTGILKPDRECTQNYSPDAMGDGSEEDGLTTWIGTPGSSYNWVIRLNANQAAKTVYYGLWCDWDGNNNFTSGLDAFYSGSVSITGITNRNVSVAVPVGGSNAAFRVMVSDASITSGMYNASITNGEIEDYTLLQILAAPGSILMGSRQSTGNMLIWKNTSGLPVKNYSIERSTDHSSWTSLGSVIPTPGNNTQVQYSYFDVIAGKESYYRLKLILADDNYQYSNILPLVDKNNSAPVIIYPNPATNSLTVQTVNSDYIRFNILDPTGRLEMTHDINAINTRLNISNLSPGMHVIKFIKKDGTEEIQRFVKIK